MLPPQTPLVPIQLSELAWEDILRCLDCAEEGEFPIAHASSVVIMAQLKLIHDAAKGRKYEFSVILRERTA